MLSDLRRLILYCRRGRSPSGCGGIMNSGHGASQIFRWFSVLGVHFLSLALSEASIQKRTQVLDLGEY